MTQSELMYLIADELGFECDLKFQRMFASWYGMYSSSVSSSLMYLTLYRQTIFYLLSSARSRVDVTIGFDEIKKSQEFKNLLDMLKAVNQQLKDADPFSVIPELVSVSGENDLPDIINEFVELRSELFEGVKV